MKSTIFSKHRPDIKLTTRLDAEGREIEVEVREDEESTQKQREIMDILVDSGYFRAYIKGLSTFNKIVGGMVWCMEACDHDVAVELLFDESLSIGQQIALTEKIIAVLPEMSCPYQLEPHQIQGLDVIHIFPVVQWLCKKSSENRREKAKKLREFGVGQFHNSFQLASDRRIRMANLRMLQNIRHVEGLFGPQRQYRRKVVVGCKSNEDERTRVRLTLLEYGDKGMCLENDMLLGQLEDLEGECGQLEEIDIEVLLKSLSITGEEEIDNLEVEEIDRERLKLHFARVRAELEMDSAELKLRSTMTDLEADTQSCEDHLEETKEAYSALLNDFKSISSEIEAQQQEELDTAIEIRTLEQREKECNHSILDTVQSLIQKNEQLKQEEQDFKESCRKEMAELNKIIEEPRTPALDAVELHRELDHEHEQLQKLRLQVARQNRQLTTVQRQLDNIPDRTELAQYQKRFLELYNQVLAKHRETKQFFSLFNTLSQTKTCLEKELNLLNSIFDSYHQAMGSSNAKAEFLKQLESYVDSIGQLKLKQKQRCDEEKSRRDEMNGSLLALVDEQRHLAAIIKQLKQEFSRNDELSREYRVLVAKKTSLSSSS